jgi:1-acyl-sn-glycerol-3-phosphate acyltransferase
MWFCVLTLAAAINALVRWRRSGLSAADFFGLGLFHVYSRLWHGVVINARPPCYHRGPAIIVVNHTCSADAAFVACGFRGPPSYLVADNYYKIPGLRWLFTRMNCVPVQRNGRDVQAIRLGLRRLSEGRILCIFPEGGLSNAGRRRPRPGKAGAALLALRSRAPVYPVRISGGPQTHRVLRAWVRPTRARVTFGPAVDLTAYYGRPINRKLLEEVRDLLMRRIAELEPPTHHRPGGQP